MIPLDRLRVIGISEMAVSDCRDEVLVTYSLGSCVGVTLFDPVTRFGGMIHCMLPVSSIDVARANQQPAMFVNTGLVALIKEFLSRGAVKKDLICYLAGAGSPLEDNGTFRIGERNLAVARVILERNRISIRGEHVGGPPSRTMYLHMETGRTLLKINAHDWVEL